jgi:hypothetical protein
MKKYLFLLFIIVAGFTVEDVQKEFIVLKWNEISNAEDGIPVYSELNFENAGFPNPESIIPVYCRIYELDNDNQDYRFSFENAVFEEVKLSADFPGYDKIENDIKIVSQKFRSRDIYNLQLLITTLKKVGNKIFRLKSFELKQIPVEAIKSLKSGQAAKKSYSWKTSSVLKQGKLEYQKKELLKYRIQS